MDYKKKYLKYKNKYLQLKSNINGGDTEIKYLENLNNQCTDPKIITKIKELTKKEFQNLKKITINDLSGLDLRIGNRFPNKDKIDYIVYVPPKVIKYLNDNNISSDCYAKIYPDIYGTPLKNLILDFNTNKKTVRVAFADNYRNNRKSPFEINLPIKFVDFIEKLFDHFNVVSLEGYPDNGGIDGIKYDDDNDIYLVQTWS